MKLPRPQPKPVLSPAPSASGSLLKIPMTIRSTTLTSPYCSSILVKHQQLPAMKQASTRVLLESRQHQYQFSSTVISSRFSQHKDFKNENSNLSLCLILHAVSLLTLRLDVQNMTSSRPNKMLFLNKEKFFFKFPISMIAKHGISYCKHHSSETPRKQIH